MVEYYRSAEEVVWGESMLFPFQGICPDLDEPRNIAIIEVLQRIPADDYRALEELVGSFTWYIPSYESLAGVMPFCCTHPDEPIGELGLTLKAYARVIFLSPRMADAASDVAVAAVAHELAHILLDHELMIPSGEYERQEDEAWSKVREWGFTREEEAHKQYYRGAEIDCG